MIATHQHAISKRLYAFRCIQHGMAQYSDGTGAVLCVPVNGGVMIPCGERDEPIRPDRPWRPHLDFLNASGKKKFDAMMFWPRGTNAV